MSNVAYIRVREVIEYEDQDTGKTTTLVDDEWERTVDDLDGPKGLKDVAPVSGAPVAVPLGGVDVSTNPALLWVKNLATVEHVVIINSTGGDLTQIPPGMSARLFVTPGDAPRWSSNSASVTAKVEYLVIPCGAD